MKSMLRMSIVLLALVSVACSKKTDTSDSAEWPEMDSFHMIMADAFHPYKDSLNLEPAKRLAEEMATAAETWQAAPLPEKVNNDDVKAQLEKLKGGTRGLAEQVKGGASDDEIGASLTSLHDIFHAISEAWYGGDGKHEH